MSSSLFTNATRSSPLRRCKHRYRRGEVVRRAAADLGRDTIEAFSLLVQWFAAVCPNPAHRSTSPLRRCRHRRDELVRRAAADLPRAALEAFWLFVLWLISQFAAVYNFSSAQRRGGAKRPADDAPRSKAADKRGCVRAVCGIRRRPDDGPDDSPDDGPSEVLDLPLTLRRCRSKVLDGLRTTALSYTALYGPLRSYTTVLYDSPLMRTLNGPKVIEPRPNSS
mmetsp:Transcript_21072/g.74954  ORF Transcript_21072/g.74954 Transcript_21072/m.74954 type:complete len:223 (+) Transcript_21072:175-843(+)